MFKYPYLFAAVAICSTSCAALNSPCPFFQTTPGQVGASFNLPKGFVQVHNIAGPGSIFVNLDIPAAVTVSDLPLPYQEVLATKPLESGHLSAHTVDSYAFGNTREEGAVLVSARSLFWDRKTCIGAVEIVYTLPNVSATRVLNPTWTKNVRTARVITAKGIRHISLRNTGPMPEKFDAAWNEIVASIKVDKSA